MKKKSPALMILVVFGCFLTVVLAVLALVPFLNKVLAVEVAATEQPEVTKEPLPDAPEEVPVTVYYVMEEHAKKISRIYIEVFPVGTDTVLFMEVPVDTRVNLSEDLYKSLQTYAPELPQYLKLSNMAESFSESYGLTGGNRILSEAVGISFKEYVRTEKEAFSDWLKIMRGEIPDTAFFEAYTKWLDKTTSSRTTEERWMYYESRKLVHTVVMETAPGSQNKDGFLLSGKRSKERLEELVTRRKITTEAEKQE